MGGAQWRCIAINSPFKDFSLYRILSDFTEDSNSYFILKNIFCSMKCATSGVKIAHFMVQKARTQNQNQNEDFNTLFVCSKQN